MMRGPNLNRNAVRWETQANSCIADGQVNRNQIRFHQHFNVFSTQDTTGLLIKIPEMERMVTKRLLYILCKIVKEVKSHMHFA